LSRRLPLEGVRVLAFTHVAAGPYCTLQLASLGAEVIKVESSSKIDAWRYRDRNHDPERSRPFADHNKNTRSITLNAKSPAGRALALRLARECDVVIDNFSAGVLDRLGLGYANLSAGHAGIIMVHLFGLGAEGPRSHWVTFGPSMMAMSGMTALWGHAERREPVGSQTSYPDYLVGAYAAYAVVAALLDRDVDGHGRELDLTQLQVVEASLGPAVVAAANGIAGFQAQGNRDDVDAPRGAYPCAGGNDDWCVVSVRTNAHWEALAALLGRPDLAGDPRYATAADRLAHRAELDELVSAWTVGFPSRTVMEVCQAAGVPAGMVATGRDLARDPHLVERGFLVDMEHPRMGVTRFPGPGIRLGAEPLPVWRLGPLMGEDNRLIFGGLLGLSEDEIAALEADGTLA
jgi:crotonobetainyl-CoA:carnitine CoA-transferase CaiB-like acyl-CoA transferase